YAMDRPTPSARACGIGIRRLARVRLRQRGEVPGESPGRCHFADGVSLSGWFDAEGPGGHLLLRLTPRRDICPSGRRVPGEGFLERQGPPGWGKGLEGGGLRRRTRWGVTNTVSRHRVSRPASSTNCEPVMKRALSEARQTTASATSCGSIHGSARRLPAERSACSCGLAPSNAARPSFIGVLTPVGCRDTTRML